MAWSAQLAMPRGAPSSGLEQATEEQQMMGVTQKNSHGIAAFVTRVVNCWHFPVQGSPSQPIWGLLGLNSRSYTFVASGFPQGDRRTKSSCASLTVQLQLLSPRHGHSFPGNVL